MDPKRMSTKVTQAFVSLAELTLFVRVVFRLFDADTGNSFVNWVYAMSEPLLEPLRNVISSTEFDQRFVLDFQALLAMAFWALLGYLALVVVNVVPKPRVDRSSGWRKWVRNLVS
ncbi:MAG: YggT family protein [Candidatus Saccharimonadales bacterium]|nr:YggT family protein [Candidatus Saccharimonadales bacterium]